MLLVTFLFVLGTVSSSELPVIKTGMVNVTTGVGTSVTLYCEATGKPTPRILIVKKSSDADFSSRTDTVPNDGEVEENHEVTAFKVLTHVLRSDEGWYVCVASNKHGIATNEAYLKIGSSLCRGVKCPSKKYCHANYTTMETECRCKKCEDDQYKPVCGSNCQSYMNPCHLRRESCAKGLGLIIAHKGVCKVEEAVLRVPGPTVQVFEGEALTLTCTPTGLPTPILVRWAKVMRSGKLKIVGSSNEYTVPASEVAGTYRCLAQQCRKRVKSVDVEVIAKRVEDPIVDMKTCRVFGDPHIQTFDGTNYDFMGRCNYVLAVDCFMNKWMVLGQFMVCGDGVTCLEQITLYYGTMRPLTLTRGWIVGQDGQKFRLKRRKPTVIDELVVTYTGLSLEIEFPDGVQLVYDGFWSIQIMVHKSHVTCGLCGDNNGVMADDLVIGRYGDTGNDIETYGQSWDMDAEWCGMEVPSSNQTCTDQDKVEEMCEDMLSSEVFKECTTALGGQYFKESCVIDTCSTVVDRFEGLPICAFANSLSQICRVSGFDIPANFLEKLGCGSTRKFQEDVYNSGCPMAGNPPYLET